jgi:hypothetical protein
MKKIKGIKDILRESTVTVPAILYKYYKFDEYTQRIFENNEVYFQSPAKFNDPFDSKIRIDTKATREQKKRYFRELSPIARPVFSRKQHLEMEKLIMRDKTELKKMEDWAQKNHENVRKKMGIFCMSKKNDNILMWSHYADKHTGFCIGFKTDNILFSCIKRVDYDKELPCIKMYESDWKKANELIAKSLLIKAEAWKYEKEWRIVKPDGVGVKKYPEEALACVIFGCKISPENRKKIIEWCSSRKTQPRFFEARDKESEFGLDIIPIS